MKISSGFRPLIRGFFFYCFFTNANNCAHWGAFPSPYSGILFLFLDIGEKLLAGFVSVPLFGDSFFIITAMALMR